MTDPVPFSGPSATAVVAEGLFVRHGDIVAVEGLSFAARAGEVTCLVGRNGAGKTSTIEVLEGFRAPSGGRVSVLGCDPVRDARRLAPRIGVMLQEVGIQPAVRVGEAVRHAGALYPDAWVPGELIELVGLTGREGQPFRRLSGGEQRRLALALALVGRPEVVFLDEPTAGVDPEGRLALRALLAELRDQGVTVLLSSHELDEVERVADRVVVIDRGRLLADGSLEEVTQGPSGRRAVRFQGPVGLDVASLSLHLGAEVWEVGPGTYRVHAASTPQVVAAVTGWLAERDIAVGVLRAGRETLEEGFLRLLADGDVGGGSGGAVGGCGAGSGVGESGGDG